MTLIKELMDWIDEYKEAGFSQMGINETINKIIELAKKDLEVLIHNENDTVSTREQVMNTTTMNLQEYKKDLEEVIKKEND